MIARDGWLRSFVVLYLEVEAGLRPARHLRPFMAAELRADVGGCGRLGRTPTIVRIMTQRHGGVCEAVALLDDGHRVSALAIAIRRQQEGWRVTAIRRPETPILTEPPVPAQVGWEAETFSETRTDTPGPRWTIPAGWTRPARAA